jgi:hypothetical protein
VPPAPVNTVAPVISGTMVVGQTLTTTNGTWTNSPTSFTYKWYKGITAIVGATSSTYILVQADAGTTTAIKCEVTAINLGGSTAADSNTLTTVYDADAQAFITAAVITVLVQMTAINELTIGLKADSLWTSMSALYPFVGGTATSHSYNLKNIAQHQITWSGGVTHNANGITGNGINAFGNTNLLDSSLNANNKHLSIYQRNILTSPSGSPMGINYINRFYLNFAANNYSTLATNQAPYPVVSPQRGFMCLAKISATPTVFKYYQNALTPTSRVASSISQIGNHFVLACLDIPTSTGFDYTVSNLAFSSIGSGLTDTDATNFYTAVQAFQTTLSRQV